MNQHEKTWETYVASWNAPARKDKYVLLQNSLAVGCAYTDPLAQTRNWEQLMGEGVGYGEYDSDGKLISISNFFQVPEH